jgi:hypothetical protein
MQQVYKVLAYLIAAGVILQAAWIGLGAFTIIKDIEDGLTVTEDTELNLGQSMHGFFGMMVIPLLALLLFISSFFAKVDQGVKWAGFVLLAVVLQVVLAFVAFGVPVVGLLHPVNAFVVLGLAAHAGRRAQKSAEERVPVSA